MHEPSDILSNEIFQFTLFHEYNKLYYILCTLDNTVIPLVLPKNLKIETRLISR